jgi:hypothetical protein
MKTFEVQYGSDIRNLRKWVTEANNAEHAKTLFRKKFGYDFIKIQCVVEI